MSPQFQHVQRVESTRIGQGLYRFEYHGDFGRFVVEVTDEWLIFNASMDQSEIECGRSEADRRAGLYDAWSKQMKKETT